MSVFAEFAGCGSGWIAISSGCFFSSGAMTWEKQVEECEESL